MDHVAKQSASRDQVASRDQDASWATNCEPSPPLFRSLSLPRVLSPSTALPSRALPRPLVPSRAPSLARPLARSLCGTHRRRVCPWGAARGSTCSPQAPGRSGTRSPPAARSTAAPPPRTPAPTASWFNAQVPQVRKSSAPRAAPTWTCERAQGAPRGSLPFFHLLFVLSLFALAPAPSFEIAPLCSHGLRRGL